MLIKQTKKRGEQLGSAPGGCPILRQGDMASNIGTWTWSKRIQWEWTGMRRPQVTAPSDAGINLFHPRSGNSPIYDFSAGALWTKPGPS